VPPQIPTPGRSVRAESGATALQLGLLLVVPVVVASTFAASVINAGKFATDTFNNAALSAVRDISSGLELRGPVSLRTDGHAITDVVMDVSLTAGGAPVSLDPAAPADRTLVSYTDDGTSVRDVPYRLDWLFGDGDSLLEPGETVELDVDVSGITPTGDTFTIEVRPARGMYLTVRRNRPTSSELPRVMDLW